MARPRRYTDDQLVAAVAASTNMSSILVALDIRPSGGNYDTVRRRMAALGIDASHIRARRRSSIEASDEEVRDAVLESRSLAQVLIRLGRQPGGRCQSMMGERVMALGIDTSHFLGQGWRRGSRAPTVPAARLDEILVEGRPSRTSHLRARLVAVGLKNARCEVCLGITWNGMPIPLELDHINGRRDDNRLANLRLLCPNCHAQTSTYRGRNIGAAERYPLTARVLER